MSSLVDFDTVASAAKERQATASVNGDLVFVNRSNTQPSPLVFLPISKLLSYQQVFDKQAKTSYLPMPGEKASTRYLVQGLDPDGQPHVYVLGQQITEEIAKVYKILKSKVPVSISSTGADLKTEYSVEPYEGQFTKPPARPAEVDLAAIASSLVKPRPGVNTAVSNGPTIPASQLGDTLKKAVQSAAPVSADELPW